MQSSYTPNPALQRTQPSRSGCNPRAPWTGPLSLGRYCYSAEDRFMVVRPRRRASAPGRMPTVAKIPFTVCFEESELPISPGSSFKSLGIGNP